MNEQVQELYNLPQNQMRKLGVLGSCISQLDSLKRRYMPTFDEDPCINTVLQLLRTEHDNLLAELRQRPDAIALLEEFFKEN